MNKNLIWGIGAALVGIVVGLNLKNYLNGPIC
jgi:hypothetical protein